MCRCVAECRLCLPVWPPRGQKDLGLDALPLPVVQAVLASLAP